MFGLLRAKNNDKEVTTNPDILFNSDILITELTVHGLKLQDRVDLIPVDQISTTTFDQYPADGLRFPDSGAKMIVKNNKVYYESTEGLKEYLLKDRIHSVLEFGGIFHMKSGAKYVIQNKVIIGIGIHGNIVAPYKKIQKTKVEEKFGKASEIKEDYEQTDGELWNTSFIYESRKMIINFFEPDKEIDFINIGLFPYSADN